VIKAKTGWRNDSLFNKWCWKSGYRYAEAYLSPCIKISSKLIKDFNVRPEILKLPQENI
jgi:hypothetical protein